MNTVSEAVSEAVQLPILDRGTLYADIPKPPRHHRIKKTELHEFIRWLVDKYNGEDGDKIKGFSCPKIANLYYQETNKYITKSTVLKNRDGWCVKDGVIVRE